MKWKRFLMTQVNDFSAEENSFYNCENCKSDFKRLLSTAEMN